MRFSPLRTFTILLLFLSLRMNLVAQLHQQVSALADANNQSPNSHRRALTMDFLQLVDPTSFAAASAVRVLIELVVAAVFAVALGVGLRVVPEKLVSRAKTTRADGTSAAKPARVTTAATITPAAARVPKSASAKAAPVLEASTSAATAPKTAPKAAPAAVPAKKPAASTATATSAAASKADNTLDDVLDSFFEDEDLLDEALLDTAAPTTEAPAAPKQEPPTAKPNSPTAKPAVSTASTAPRAQQKNDAFSKELAAKMTKGLQGKTPAAPAPKPTTMESAATADRELDDALDAYLAEEQLLDEAILDSAVQEAQH